MIRGSVYTPTDTVYGRFNTCDPDTGAPITLAGTPALRLERNRGGTWSEITGNGITLSVDEDDTGRHEYAIDLDDANIAAQAGDLYVIAINTGTVDSNSAVGLEVGHFFVEADGLTTQQKADVNAEVDTAISDASLATASALATVDSNVDAILVDTGTTLPGTLSTMDGKLDTIDSNVDSVLEDTGTTIPGTITTIDSVVDAIKVKTDSLTFTQAGAVDANITHVNETEVGGDGGEGTEWGPAAE